VIYYAGAATTLLTYRATLSMQGSRSKITSAIKLTVQTETKRKSGTIIHNPWNPSGSHRLPLGPPRAPRADSSVLPIPYLTDSWLQTRHADVHAYLPSKKGTGIPCTGPRAAFEGDPNRISHCQGQRIRDGGEGGSTRRSVTSAPDKTCSLRSVQLWERLPQSWG
jgi:hypothetical protein